MKASWPFGMWGVTTKWHNNPEGFSLQGVIISKHLSPNQHTSVKQPERQCQWILFHKLITNCLQLVLHAFGIFYFILLQVTIIWVWVCNLSLPKAPLQLHICENALAAYCHTLPLLSTSSLFRASVRLILFRLIFLANARHSLCL